MRYVLRQGFRPVIVLVVVMVLVGVVHIVVAEEADESQVFLPAVFNGAVPTFCDTQPVLLEPANGTTLDTLNPLYRFTNTNDPAGVWVVRETATDPLFSNLVSAVYSAAWEGESAFRDLFGNLEPATVHYWRVRIFCDDGDGEWPHVEGPWSETWTFTTGYGEITLPAPTLISPPDGSGGMLPVTFSWEPVAGTVEYLLKIERPSGGWTLYTVADTTFTWSFAPDGDGIYTWRVSARNDYAIGTPSAERSFSLTGSQQTPLTGLADGRVAIVREDNTLIEQR